MAAAVAAAMALPGWFGTSPEVHRALTAPASSSKRVIHVDVRVASPRRGVKAQGSREALGARSSSLAGNVIRQTGSSTRTAGPRQDLSAGHGTTRARPPHKPRPVPPTTSAPGPAPTPAPAPAPAPVVAAPASQSEPTRELASAAPAPTPAPPDSPSPKAQRRDGATNDDDGGSQTDTPDCDRGSQGGNDDGRDHGGDGGRRDHSDDHGGHGRDK